MQVWKLLVNWGLKAALKINKLIEMGTRAAKEEI